MLKIICTSLYCLYITVTIFNSIFQLTSKFISAFAKQIVAPKLLLLGRKQNLVSVSLRLISHISFSSEPVHTRFDHQLDKIWGALKGASHVAYMESGKWKMGKWKSSFKCSLSEIQYYKQCEMGLPFRSFPCGCLWERVSQCVCVQERVTVCTCVCRFFSVGSGWTARRFRLSTSYGNDDKKWQPQLQLLSLLCALACAKGRQGEREMESRREKGVWGRVSVCEFDLVAVPEARQLLEYS